MATRTQTEKPERGFTVAEMPHLLRVPGHDLDSPLTALKGRLQLFHRRLVRSGSGHADLRDIDRMLALVERMSQQIALMLDTAQLQRHAFALDVAPTDLNAVVQQAVALQQAISPETPIHYEAPPVRIEGCWDRVGLGHALVAVLNNAARFGKKGTPVYVRAQHVGRYARVEVEDEGIGVPFAERHLIFNFGRRASNAERFAGAGLGLFVAREIVHLHGGEIGVDAGQRDGSRFWFTLPLRAEDNTLDGR